MKIMAIDYGDARTGFAISDRSEFLASPIGTVPERNAASPFMPFKETIKRMG